MFVIGVPTWGHSLVFQLGWVCLVKSLLLDRRHLLVNPQCQTESDSVTQFERSRRAQ